MTPLPTPPGYNLLPPDTQDALLVWIETEKWKHSAVLFAPRLVVV